MNIPMKRDIAEHFQVGDVIRIGNWPGVPRDKEWRVDAIVPGRGIRLRPVDDPFNDATGEFWITGPEDRPFD